LPFTITYYLRQGGYVFIGVCLFVSRSTAKLSNRLHVTKFGGKVAHEPRKKPLDFGGNPDHVTLGFGLV